MKLYSAMCEVLLLFKGHITPQSSGSIHDEAPCYSCIDRYKRKKKKIKTACELQQVFILGMQKISKTMRINKWRVKR